MSEHLANLGILRDVIRMHQPAQASHDSTLELILLELVNRIEHLEAQQETPASASQSTEQPVPSSSEATEPGTGTSDGWSISYSLSSHARADGSLPLSVVGDIWAWCNSQLRHGGPQEVEIGVILTSKASTPPAGSASPSTGEPTREGSGVAGSYDMGPFLEADSYPDSPASSPEPAQGGSACVGSADRDPANCISQGCINAGRCLFTNHEGRE